MASTMWSERQDRRRDSAPRREVRSSERTREELYEEAKRRGIPGRSKMSKTELQRAIGR